MAEEGEQLRKVNQDLQEVVFDVKTTKKQLILDAYGMVDPSDRMRKAEVLSAGGSHKDWVMRVGDGIGRAGTKKDARMIAIVRSSLDPEFTGDAPARVSDSHLATIERKRTQLLAELEQIRPAKKSQPNVESVP